MCEGKSFVPPHSLARDFVPDWPACTKAPIKQNQHALKNPRQPLYKEGVSGYDLADLKSVHPY